jgi:hypothetical protein
MVVSAIEGALLLKERLVAKGVVDPKVILRG